MAFSEFVIRMVADAEQFERGFNRSSRSLDEFERSTRSVERAFREQFGRIADDAEDFENRTEDLIDTLRDLARTQQEVSDVVASRNRRVIGSFFQLVGVLEAASTQTSRLQSNLRRFGGPLRTIDRQVLAISDRMEEFARRNNTARVALELLGPTASMRDLVTLTEDLNRGIERTRILFLGGLIVFAAVLVGLTLLSNVIDGRLIPAAEEFREVWKKALKPIVTLFTDVALSVINLGIKIGEFFAQMAESNPILSKMIFGFLALLPAIVAILAPLTIGIGVFRAFPVAAAATITAFRQIIIAFFSIIGTTVLVTAAIVAIIAIFVKMKQNSEILRDALANAWSRIKETFLTAIEPLLPKLTELRDKIVEFVNSLIGNEEGAKGFWKILGDAAGTFINFFINSFVPVFQSALEFVVTVLSNTIDLMIVIFERIQEFWAENGPTIIEFFSRVFEVIGEVVGKVVGFLTETLSGLQEFWNEIWPDMKEIFETSLRLIAAIVKPLLLGIQTVWSGGISPLLGIVRQNFGNIATIIRGVLSIVKGIIQVTLGLISGNWNSVWKGLASVIFGVRSSVTSAISIMKSVVVRLFSGMAGSIRSIWNSIPSSIRGAMNRIIGFINRGIDSMRRFGFSIPSSIPFIGGTRIGLGFIPKIPFLQEGGVVTAPTLAVLGEGGDEAVIPLDRFDELQGGNESVNIIIENMFVREEEDISRIAEEIFRLQQTRLRARGV